MNNFLLGISSVGFVFFFIMFFNYRIAYQGADVYVTLEDTNGLIVTDTLAGNSSEYHIIKSDNFAVDYVDGEIKRTKKIVSLTDSNQRTSLDAMTTNCFIGAILFAIIFLYAVIFEQVKEKT